MVAPLVDDFIGKVFGERNQLKVLLWDGSRNKNGKGNILYTVQCNICINDPEMYGDATYLVTKGHLTSGRYPCGCSKSPKLSEEQVLLKVKRACEKIGHTFLRIHGEYNKTRTRIVASCPTHGEMEHKAALDILSGRGCVKCREDKVKNSLTLPDEHFINRFLATGNFHPDTVFKRSERLTPASRYVYGTKMYWDVHCPVCDKCVEGHATSLLGGHSPCACSSFGKVFMYLHAICEEGDSLALKYGVATSPNKRLAAQAKKCIYDVIRVRLWRFKDSSDCRQAEAEIKRVIPSKLLSKEDMEDGWTETCSPEYQDAIEEIVMRFGGILW